MSETESQTSLDDAEEESKEQSALDDLNSQKEKVLAPNQEFPIKNGQIHPKKFCSPLENPKTANRAFGSISDFLLFFENRNPQIKELTKKFQEMEEMVKKNISWSLKILNEKIRSALCQSFQTMPVEFKNYDGSSKEIVKIEDNKSKLLKEQRARNKYLKEFEKDFSSLEEFYKRILKAYTIPGFLYKRMNEFLRTENWTELDNLLIYTYCLFKAYQWGSTGLTDANSFSYLKSKTNNNGILTLYRRADFDKKSLKFYSSGQVNEFSWNGVTSTSLNPSATVKFSRRDLMKKPVLIIIEVDFQGLQPENFNGLYLANLSECPLEEEVALAPGSIFRLLDLKTRTTEGKEEIEIRLRLLTDAKILARQGRLLHGMLQSVMRDGKKLRITCLMWKDLSRAIKHCKGNLLIEELEFNLCNFNGKAGKALLGVLATLKNLTSFGLNTVVLEGSCNLEKIMQSLGKLKIKNLEILTSLHQDDQVKSLIKSIPYLKSLRKIKLTFAQTYKMSAELIKDLHDASIRHLHSECSLEFQIQDGLSIFTKHVGGNPIFSQDFHDALNSQSQEDEEILKNFLQGELRVSNKVLFGQNFSYKSISDINSFSDKQQDIEMILKTPNCIQVNSLIVNDHLILLILRLVQENFRSLKTLHLHFAGCKRMTGCWTHEDQDSELRDETIGSAETLISSNLESDSWIQNTEKCSRFFRKIQDSNSLNTFHLTFAGCLEITNKTSTLLQIAGFLKSLTALNLTFDVCDHILESSFDLARGLRNSKALTALNLNFSGCRQIREKALTFSPDIKYMESLKTPDLNFTANKKFEIFQQIGFLNSLTTLHLSFAECSGITDQGLESLQGIGDLKLLTNFSLNFDGCNQITDKSLEFLRHIAANKLISILSLNFSGCNKITNKGSEFLQQIGNLEFLTVLHLNFAGCLKITDQTLTLLERTRDLKSLTTLDLNFAGCIQITDEGLKFLRQAVDHQGISTLNLNFSGCNQVTEKGFEFLRKIECLISLTTLQLNLIACIKITNKTMNLLGGIRNLKSLAVLDLSFDGCEEITDDGLKFFEQIGCIRSLTTVRLSLAGCSKITDQTLKSLQQIGDLELLKTLHLNFSQCHQLKFRKRDRELEPLGFIGYLKSLTSLSLNFNGCEQIRNYGLVFLRQIQFLESLISLNLSFSDCLNITDPSLAFLRQTCSLEKLTSLYLNFEGCVQITDRVLEFLHQIGGFNSLTSLHLNFGRCPEVTDKALQLFKIFGYMELLTSLSLKFDACKKITDQGLEFIWDLRSFKTLNSLQLSFIACEKISDQGLKDLCEGISYLNDLTTLSLCFSSCQKIERKRVDGHLKGDLRCHLKFLKNIHLDFDYLRQVEELHHQVLENKRIPSNSEAHQVEQNPKNNPLIIPVICQGNFDPTTQENYPYICCLKDIGNLKRLQSLHLRFDSQNQVSDSHMEELASQLIKHSDTLINLYLDFRGCAKITDEGLSILLKKAIKKLESLANLHINFDKCVEITNKGIQSIDWGFKSLKSLSLSFNACSKVTEESLDFLCKNLESLVSLSLIIPSAIISEEFERNLTKLESLSAYAIIAQNKIPKGNLQDFNLKRSNPNRKNERKESEDKGKQNGKKPFVNLICFKKPSFSSGNKIRFLNRENRKIIGPDQSFVKEESKFSTQSQRSLQLTLLRRREIEDKLFQKILGKDVHILNSLGTLNLNFHMCNGLTDEKLKSLASQVTQHFKSLTTLQMNFEKIENIYSEEDRGFNLSRILKQLFRNEGLKNAFRKTQPFEGLATLHLNFVECGMIIDAGLEAIFSEAIQQLKSLKTLELNFERCRDFVDNEIENIWLKEARGSRILPQVPRSIRNKGLKGTQSFALLTTLNLSFVECNMLTDEILEVLCSEVIQQLTSLTNLSLNLSYCQKITDEGLMVLCSEGIPYLKLLMALDLSFNGLGNITSRGLEILYEGIRHIKSPTTLCLNFEECCEITELEFKYLYYLLLGQFPALNPSPPSPKSPKSCKFSYLPLNSPIAIVPDIDIKCFERLWFHRANFSSRVSCRLTDFLEQNKPNNIIIKDGFTLRFENANQITDDDLHTLTSGEELRRLGELKTCHFIFDGCIQLMGQGSGYRSFCQVLQNFQSLTTLSLCFNGCLRMTDSGIKTLCSEGIQYMKLLESFYFSCDGTNEITDYGFQYLCRNGISQLASLKSLDLNVNVRGGISDGGLQSLCEGIQNLDTLISLKFILKNGDKITDKGLKILISEGMPRLLKLENIQLSFPQTLKVSPNIYHAFTQILSYFGFESNSNLI